ncbi:MAG: ribulose-phosphate 3-epimerase [Kiritimatiellae bacterium]|nr:ribulose-phosphate 3-epimerase [Kiritimatiellia bacterium]
MKIEILPSLLAADYAKLADEILRAANAGADAMHIDIMDPHFVPNLSFGPDIVALCKRIAPNLYRNTHLMMSRPDLYIEKFAAAGAETLQIHYEADCDIHSCLRAIKALGVKAALTINPETPVEVLRPYLKEADEFLVMTVHPGYGGQKFISECLSKVTWLREKLPQIDIMVDGGVNGQTAIDSARAGANQLVSGSFLFKQDDMKAQIASMRANLEELI